MNNLDKKKPFLLVICTHEPHSPVAPPDSLATPFMKQELLPLIRQTNYGGVDREGNYILENAAKYYGTISQLDNAFGTFIDGLDQAGFRENSLVFLTSDNGPEHPVNLEESRGEWSDTGRDNCYGTPGPFRGMKRYPYEGGHRVPGLVRWPEKIPAGTLSDELVCGVDILPTFCKVTGIKVPNDRKIDGEPVINAFLNKPVEHKNPYLWIFPTHEDTYYRMPHMAMRTGDLVLMGWFPTKKAEEKLVPWMTHSIPVKFELYDILKDPGQMKDLSKSLPEESKKMSEQMVRLWLDIRQDYVATAGKSW
jgi:arylsulfatase A